MSDQIRMGSAVPDDNDRNRLVELNTLRKMLKGLSRKDWHRPKLPTVQTVINEVLTAYRDLRKLLRNSDDPYCVKGGYASHEVLRIKKAMKTTCFGYNWDAMIEVRKGYASAKYKKPYKRGGKGDVEFAVGYMWRHNVYENIHKDNRLRDYVVLAATEYRTNVQHVRLYDVTVYSVTSKKTMTGWVGQTKIGRQKCAFSLWKENAIAAALRLTTQEIDHQINGEKQ